MKQKNMILLALAIGCGLVAAFLTAKLGAGSKGEMVPVLVAAKNLDQGTKLDKPEELFVRKPFPKESVPPEFVDDITQLKGKVLQRSVRAGSHCTMGDVTPRTGIELPIDPATGVMYNAMAIKVDPATVVGGLVVPGAKVDVVCVERRPNGKTSSTMILQNVLVVGVNETTVRPDDQGYIKNAQTVTLAVKQQEGMILALAGERGKVSLMLRDPNNTKIKKNMREVVDYQPRSREDDPTEGTSQEKTRVAIAKQTITAGTKIDDPTDYFEEMEWPSTLVPDNFITKIDDLKGKTVVKDLLKNSPVVKEAFEGEAPKTDRAGIAGANPKSDVNRHTITFQVGGSMPYYAHFKNGKLEDATQPPAPAGQTPSNVITPPTDNKNDQNQ